MTSADPVRYAVLKQLIMVSQIHRTCYISLNGCMPSIEVPLTVSNIQEQSGKMPLLRHRRLVKPNYQHDLEDIASLGHCGVTS